MFLQELQPRMRLVTGDDIVVLERADRAIEFQNSYGDISYAGDAVLPQSALHFVDGQVLAREM